MTKTKRSITLPATREQDYTQWYLEVIRAAGLAENSAVRGSMTILPWGYAIWERIQRELDDRFKATGHENAYFPLLIPQKLLEKEAQHVEGFAKEVAVVTHSRLESDGNGGLRPGGKLEENYIIRPTSEMIIGASFSRWVQSHRDLPLLINQWANVMRWEMRTRLFLRTSEFLWQEGHTAHATAAEAHEETMTMLEVYRSFAEDILGMPVVAGEKTADERFPGAERTFTIEAMMQDGKALQAGTSHDLGQNFARSCDIQFTDRDGVRKHAFTTSWGVSTRLIGGLVMTHADDIGLRLPPTISPHQVVLVPMDVDDDRVMQAASALALRLREQTFRGGAVRVHVDRRDVEASSRRWQWIRRGAPIVVMLGSKDLDSATAMVTRRWLTQPDRELVVQDVLVERIDAELEAAQSALVTEARDRRREMLRTDLTTTAELVAAYEAGWRGGAVVGWDGGSELPEKLAAFAVTRRCVPLKRIGSASTCAFTGSPAIAELVLARTY